MINIGGIPHAGVRFAKLWQCRPRPVVPPRWSPLGCACPRLEHLLLAAVVAVLSVGDPCLNRRGFPTTGTGIAVCESCGGCGRAVAAVRARSALDSSVAAFVSLRHHDRGPIPSYCDDAQAPYGVQIRTGRTRSRASRSGRGVQGKVHAAERRAQSGGRKRRSPSRRSAIHETVLVGQVLHDQGEEARKERSTGCAGPARQPLSVESRNHCQSVSHGLNPQFSCGSDRTCQAKRLKRPPRWKRSRRSVVTKRLRIWPYRSAV